MIILVGGEKGGTGKTTLVTNLAAMRRNQEGDVLVIDTDKQGSASYWAATREGNEELHRVPSIQKFGSAIASEIRDLANRYQDIIIDAGGRDSIELRAAMTVVEKLIIPIQASQFDVWTLGAMSDLVNQAIAFNEGLKTFVVVNRASTNPSVSETAEAKEVLEDFENLVLLKTVIHDRIAYRKAAKSGLSVVELQPKDLKAAKEMTSLYKEVFHE
ncbi:AAA family ATPase [Crocosphaera sp. UHCC 0190]|uniref:AAA family ATPase n=1 Tax=unclassified Crocosphaera TaxID=2623705 RepID=UPI002B1F229E|nr:MULTISPECIES: AAA family ATPase [unclassified Crocosphaera]MEA5511935.1 AAA family ATPase [Crocosphaera sp. UHCC 0190]MEA5536656.1 AAA family ATPase [Crocosphaera sp. XPORK-15E]